jgi:hypothetical protein
MVSPEEVRRFDSVARRITRFTEKLVDERSFAEVITGMSELEMADSQTSDPTISIPEWDREIMGTTGDSRTKITVISVKLTIVACMTQGRGSSSGHWWEGTGRTFRHTKARRRKRVSGLIQLWFVGRS